MILINLGIFFFNKLMLVDLLKNLLINTFINQSI